MITDDDARRFLQQRGAPLEWDSDSGDGETIPPPPLDRVAFTRLVLEAAEEAGLPAVVPSQSVEESLEQSLLAFQKCIHRFLRRQTFHGVPEVRWREYPEGQRLLYSKCLTWDEYAGQLEDDYYEPWRTAWVYGVSERSAGRLLLLMKEQAAEVFRMLRYDDRLPVAAAIHDGTVLSRCLSMEEAFYFNMPTVPGMKFFLIELSWRGIPGSWPDCIRCGPGLVGLAAAVWGAIRGSYSGWWLLAVVPALLVLTVIINLRMDAANKWYWVAPERTFGDWAREIAAHYRREWAELQKQYEAHG